MLDTDQLTSADHSLQSDEAYSFDENGNRDGSQTHLGATTSSTVVANNRISTDGVYNYTWDDEGNLATKTSISSGDKEEYSYDYRNRISLVTFKDSLNVIQKTVAYRFDHDNNLLRRIETPYTSGSPGTPTADIFVTEGVQTVMAFHKGTSGNAALTDRFVWGVERDQLLTDEQVTSLSSAGTPYAIFGDQLNSVRQAATYNAGTDTTSVVKNLAYDSFGNITADSASGIILIFGYTARYKDSDTQLQLNGVRIYLSWAGMWGQEDPIKDGVNWREYVGNQPTYATDPSGLAIPVQETGDGWAVEWGVPISGGGFVGTVNVSVEAIQWGADPLVAMKLQVNRSKSVGVLLTPPNCGDVTIKQQIFRTVVSKHKDGTVTYLDKEVETSSGKYRLTTNPAKPVWHDDDPIPSGPEGEGLYFPSQDSITWYDSPSSLAGLWYDEQNADPTVQFVQSAATGVTSVVLKSDNSKVLYSIKWQVSYVFGRVKGKLVESAKNPTWKFAH